MKILTINAHQAIKSVDNMRIRKEDSKNCKSNVKIRVNTISLFAYFLIKILPICRAEISITCRNLQANCKRYP